MRGQAHEPQRQATCNLRAKKGKPHGDLWLTQRFFAAPLFSSQFGLDLTKSQIRYRTSSMRFPLSLFIASFVMPRALAASSLRVFNSSKGEVILDEDGIEYSVEDLQPYTELFSSDQYDISPDGKTVTERGSGMTLVVPVWRNVLNNGKVVVQATMDLDGSVEFAEISRETDNGTLVDTTLELEDPAALVGPDGSPIDFYFDDPAPIHGDPLVGTPEDREDEGYRRFLRQQMPHKRRSLATRCDEYTIVRLAILYDSEYCGRFGSHRKAKSRIAAVVAAASLHYERAMCVKVQLSNIRNLDKTCGKKSAAIGHMNRREACGTVPHFLGQFSKFASNYRNNANIDTRAAIHVFTGFPSFGPLGCAWIGTFCNRDFTYGVEYMSARSSIFSQGVILAHELGHNLNAVHFESSKKEYIMEARLSSGADGFSDSSVDRIRAYLGRKSITCDIPPGPKPKPTPKPAPKPTPRPTRRPVRRPKPSPNPPAPTGPKTTPTGDPSKCHLKRPMYCVEQEEDGDFACFGTTEFVAELNKQGCPVESLRLKSCDGTPTPFGRSGQCSDKCLAFPKRFCINGRPVSTMDLVFDGLDANGKPVKVTTSMPVRNRELAHCRPASIKCRK